MVWPPRIVIDAVEREFRVGGVCIEDRLARSGAGLTDCQVSWRVLGWPRQRRLAVSNEYGSIGEGRVKDAAVAERVPAVLGPVPCREGRRGATPTIMRSTGSKGAKRRIVSRNLAVNDRRPLDPFRTTCKPMFASRSATNTHADRLRLGRSLIPLGGSDNLRSNPALRGRP